MSTDHPLDPLAPDEIRHAAAILRRERGVGRGLADRVHRAAGAEPRRSSRAFAAGDSIVREAWVVCCDRARGIRLQGAGVADRRRRRVVGARSTGVQPNMTVDEWHDCDERCERIPT